MKVMCQIESGALSLGSLGICLMPKQVVELSEENLNHLDVKEAINKNWLRLEKEIKLDDVIVLNNIGSTIVSLQSINVSIPPKQSIMTYASALKSEDVSHAISRNLLQIMPSANVTLKNEPVVTEEIKIEIVKTESQPEIKEILPDAGIVNIEKELETKDVEPVVEIINTNNSQLNSNIIETSTTIPPVKRKRGRPRKIKIAEIQS
jgi:hypothetical protein